MVVLRSPFDGAEIDAPEGLVDRYLAAGWVGVESAADPDDDTPKGNASREVWAAYADSLGVKYAEDAKRDDIKDAVTASESE